MESADRRTELAADRTILAAEHANAAWMRTGLGPLASGIGAKALLEGHVHAFLSTTTSFVLVAFAAFCCVAGVWRQLDRGAPLPKPDVRTIPVALLVSFNGFLVMVCLEVLFSFVVA